MCYDAVVPWYTTVYNGVPWYTMVHHGTWYWYTMDYHGITWYTMVIYGIWRYIPWCIILRQCHNTSQSCRGMPWCTMVNYSKPWYTMVHHSITVMCHHMVVPWCTVVYHGIVHIMVRQCHNTSQSYCGIPE